MKNLRKVTTFILALAMVLSLAVTGFAAETPVTTYTLTINNEVDGHTYEAYQIFVGDLATVNEKQVLSNIEWGSGVNGDTLMDDINAEEKLAVLHNAANAAELAEKIANNITSDSESIDLLAELIGKNLTSTVVGTCADMGATYQITGLHAGYYLIKDQDNSLGDTAHDAYTKYIMHVLKNETVTPKSSVPTVDKSINETLGGTYTDVKDFDINDTVYYKWTGTLPSNLMAYDTYTYKFLDTLPTGIEFVRFEQVYMESADSNVVHTFYDVNDGPKTMPAGIETEVNGKNVTLKINDLLTLYPNVLVDQKIVVKYSARVTRDALIAEPMTNSVKVEYSNNPNGDGDGDMGTTPDDVAHAFTFAITVDKYDADNAETKLAGAEFVLYYERIEGEELVKHYAQVVTEEMIAENKVINGTPVDEGDLGVVYGWTTDENQASILDTDEKGALDVRGLDAGVFYLKETKAPGGYNLMETPVMIEIIPAYTTEGKETSVTVSYKVDSREQTSNTVGVRNSSGSTLPSTGGIGTTIFYILGGLMVLGATVVLVTKKRMGAIE